jgi:uncharacterized membrane protein YoaK (UPF0700 family)
LATKQARSTPSPHAPRFVSARSRPGQPSQGGGHRVLSKLSRAEIRTTHITGIVTDIGIELGKLLYWNRHGEQFGRIQVDRQRLQVLSLLALYFFMGGIAGAFGFNRLGYVSTLPLALLLISLALVPMLDDLRSGWRRFRRARQI